MKVIRSVVELRKELDRERASRAIGFVPTMGALHEGHLSLVNVARSRSDVVVLSIFVNPLQFGPAEDLVSYPRDEERDLRLAKVAGVDLVFVPTVEEMYPPGRIASVTLDGLGSVLEGASRPGHFDGVATVVTKLFNIVQPDVAVFGQKDAQQVAVIRRLVADLSFDIDIVVAPTVREPDGLALSSRNAYLSPEERRRAPALYRALHKGAEAFATEGLRGAERIMRDVLVEEGLEPDYATVVDPASFGSPSPDGPALLVVAARLGATRLIDNLPYGSDDHTTVTEVTEVTEVKGS